MENLVKILIIFVTIFTLLNALTAYILHRHTNRKESGVEDCKQSKWPKIKTTIKSIATMIKKLIFVCLVLLINVVIFGSIYYVIRRFNLL